MSKIHWFPGHMAKTIKELRRLFHGVDVVVELLDARIPLSSRNPIIDTIITENHHHIIALTKTDLADPVQTKQWIQSLQKKSHTVIACNVPQNKGIKQILETCKQISAQKREKRQFYIAKIMVCGIPNVGKSALINKLAKKRAAAVQNKPGVTKQTRGILLDNFLELIDSPGILWPKIDSQETSIKLALTKAIKESIVDDYPLSEWLLNFLITHYPESLKKRYHLSDNQLDPHEIRQHIAHNMKWLSTNNNINENKVNRTVIEDYQKQRLGLISLDLSQSII